MNTNFSTLLQSSQDDYSKQNQILKDKRKALDKAKRSVSKEIQRLLNLKGYSHKTAGTLIRKHGINATLIVNASNPNALNLNKTETLLKIYMVLKNAPKYDNNHYQNWRFRYKDRKGKETISKTYSFDKPIKSSHALKSTTSFVRKNLIESIGFDSIKTLNK